MLIANITEIKNTIYKHYPKIDEKQWISRKKILHIIKTVRARFNIALQRKIRRYLEECFNEYSIIDWIDREEYDCYQYKVLIAKNQDILDDDVELQKTLNGVRQDLRIYISVLDKYYFLNVEEWVYREKEDIMNQWELHNIQCIDEEFNKCIAEFEKKIQEYGYKKIMWDEASVLIDDVELKYIEVGNARVFECLFTQIDGVSWEN